jgi:hypothetical protein
MVERSSEVGRRRQPPAQRAVAVGVDARDDGQRRVQRARELRLIGGETAAGVGDRRPLVELEGVQRRGGQPGEPRAETDANLHAPRAYAAPRRFSIIRCSMPASMNRSPYGV